MTNPTIDKLEDILANNIDEYGEMSDELIPKLKLLIDEAVVAGRIGEYKAILGVDFDKFYPEDKYKDFVSLPSHWINQQISEIKMSTTITKENGEE